MKTRMRIISGKVTIASDVQPADNFIRRFIGLMGKKQLLPNEGLMLFHCSSIHCFFMKIPIDAVYLSADMTVVGIETLKPWSIGRLFRQTRHVLELPAGSTEGKITVGDTLEIV